MKARIIYEFLKNNPTIAWVFVFGIACLLIYAIIKSIQNKSYRKNFIEFCLSITVPVIILSSFIIIFIYATVHFELIENNKLFSILLLLVTAGAIIISLKKMNDFSLKSLKYSLILFSFFFVILQSCLFIEKKYTDRYFQYGRNEYQKKKYLEAINAFETYIYYRNNNLDSAYYFKIKCLLKLHKFDEANSEYRKNNIKFLDYRKEMFTELLESANNFINDTITWKRIDGKYKDSLSINFSKAGFFIDTINMKIQLKDFKYLDGEWKRFRKTSMFIARNTLNIRFSKSNIASEKDVSLFITLLSFYENKKLEETIDKNFQLKDKHLNALFIRALSQEYYLSYYQFGKSGNLDRDIEAFKLKYFKQDTSP